MSHQSPTGHGKRPLLPALTADDDLQAVQAIQAKNQELTAPPQPAKSAAKRMQITAVACQPCQQRKSKCDGARPICSSCVAKRRTDCAYDAAGDQRRTAALKQRIRALEKQAVDLKAIISGICLSTDKEAAMSVAMQLQADEFRGLDQAASILGVQGVEDCGADPSYRMEAGMPPTSQDDQASALPPLYTLNIDPALAQDMSFFQEQSSPWASNVQPRSGGSGSMWPRVISSGSMSSASRMPAPLLPQNLRSASQWAYLESPVEAAENDWQGAMSSSTYRGSSMDYGYPSDQQTRKSSFHLSSPGDNPALTQPVRESAFGEDTRQTRKRRYWYKPPRQATHINACANAAGLTVQTLRTESRQLDDTPIPIHALQPNNDPDESPESRVYTDFIQVKRRLVEQGWPIDDALGTTLINPEALVNTQNFVETGASHRTICSWASDAVNLIDGMQMPEKLATLILTVRLMRWRIIPSLENYENVPECMRPTPLQILLPHPAWIDFVPWPEIRDVFITNPEILAAGDPSKTLSAYTSVNWQWSPAEAICAVFPGAKDLRISPQFERYVENINNWSLSPACLVPFPDLADKAWIRKDDGEDEEIGRPDEK